MRVPPFGTPGKIPLVFGKKLADFPNTMSNKDTIAVELEGVHTSWHSGRRGLVD